MATKLKNKQLQELLKKIGLDVELVADDAAGIEDPNFDTLLQAVDASREGIISQKVLAAKADEVHKSVTAAANGKLRKAIADATGIPVAELAEKDAGEALKLGFEHFSKTVGGDKEAVVKQLNDALEAHKVNITNVNKEWETKYNTKVNELSQKEIIDILVAEHNTAKGLPPTANKAKLAAQFKNHLDEKAIVKVENGKIVLYDKTKPELKLLNEAKTAELTPGDLVKPYYTELGLWNEDNRHESAAAHMTGKPGQAQVQQHPVKGANGNLQTTLDQQLETFSAWKQEGAATAK